MSLRFQRRISLGKFIQLNLSKSGIGYSFGVTGLRLSKGPSGTWFTIGLPGTGLSYRKHLDSKGKARKSPETGAQTKPVPASERPEPGFFAAGAEKALFKGLNAYDAGRVDQALEHFLEAAPEEPGAAILAASILVKRPEQAYRGTELMEEVVQSDGEFPTELMQKYLLDREIEIAITPMITATVTVDGLAATLLLIELYQKQRRVREAIALLEELEELSDEPVLTLSLCELYASRNLWDNIIERGPKYDSEDDITLGIMIFYGRALQEKELHEAAVTVFTKALRRTKDRNPSLLNEVRYWRALSYLDQGKTTQANRELQRVYAENPNFRDVAQRLEMLSIK